MKPTIWQDEEFGTASHEARLLFIGLITQADDEGRMTGSARMLWSLIYPWEDFDREALEQRLGELAGAGLIQRYERDGKDYIVLPGWKNHQKISHVTRSKIPAPPRASRNGSGALRKTPEANGTPPEASSSRPASVGATIGEEGIGEERRR